MSIQPLLSTNPFSLLYPVINPSERVVSRKTSLSSALELQKLSLTDEVIDRLLSSQKKDNLKEEDKDILQLFLLNSRLMNRIDKECRNTSENLSIQEICRNCAELLHLERILKGTLLFRINDIGDKCYFLLKGKISILKPKETEPFSMSYEEYVLFLNSLCKAKEEFIFLNVIKLNYSTFPIESKADYEKLLNCLVKHSMKYAISQNLMTPHTLKRIVEQCGKTLKDFHINELEMELKFKQLNHMQDGDENDPWTEYISRHAQLTIEESSFYDRIQSGAKIDSNGRLFIKVIKYEEFMTLHQGDFFGEDSLDSVEGKRNATLRAERTCVVAYLSRDDYLHLISPKQKKLKLRVLLLLYEKYFFSSISQVLFAKYYFHFFKQTELLQKEILSPQNDVKFIIHGQVKVSISCSIADIHLLSKAVIEKLIELKPKTLSYNEISNLKENSKETFNLKAMKKKLGKESQFAIEMDRKQTFQLFYLKANDVIGLEEIYLDMPLFTNATATSGQLVYLSIAKDKLDTIIAEEKSCVKGYNALSLKKVLLFLTRLNQIKANYIAYVKAKLQKEERETMHWRNRSICCLNEEPVSFEINLGNSSMQMEPPSILQKVRFPEMKESLKKELRRLMNPIKKKEKKKDLYDKIKGLTRNKRLSSSYIQDNLPMKSHSSFNFDTKIRNNYLSIDSLRKENSKWLDESISKQQLNEEDLRKSQGRISLIDMKEINDKTAKKKEPKPIPYIQSLKVHDLNQGTINKFKPFENRRRKYLRLCHSDINGEIRPIQKFGYNYNNDLVVKVIKDYYRKKQFEGYSFLGYGKNTFNKKKAA